HKQDFKYGRIEASIKLPRGDGMWPAFWMMSSDDVYGTCAASGEIDIMEAKNTPMEIRGNLHFGGEYPDNAKTGSSAYADGSDFSQDYHLYSIEWDPKEIRWYCDNNLYKSTDVWWTGSKEDNGRDLHGLLCARVHHRRVFAKDVCRLCQGLSEDRVAIIWLQLKNLSANRSHHRSAA
ncbi:MAG: glycoside hydrolase family 16 protein, partial [Planctomycetota bacterium]